MRGGSGQRRRGGRCGQSGMWCGGSGGGHCRGAGRPDCAATEMLSAAWLPPKDSASFLPLSISLLCPLFLLCRHFFHHFPLSSFCAFSPSPSSSSCSASFSSSIPLTSLVFTIHPPTPLHVWAITDTQQWAEEGCGDCGGRMERLRGAQKA